MSRSRASEDTEKLKEVLVEAHGAIKDLTRLIREGREVVKLIQEQASVTVNDRLDVAVEIGLEAYGKAIGDAIDEATAATGARFDKIADVLLGEDPQTLKKGEPSAVDYARMIAESKKLNAAPRLPR